MYWGISPALDLLEEYKKLKSLPKEGELEILLLGSVDGRHILQSLARLGRHQEQPTMRFSVADLAMDLVARQCLLLTTALEPALGLRAKARLWMEIYGNTLLRPTTLRYLKDKACQLTLMTADEEYLKYRMPLLDLSQLRYSERDQLENIFKFWVEGKLSMAKLWDANLRRSLASRYDHRTGVFDWDYHMKLKEIEGGSRVCQSEYKQWRHTGVAFTWLETDFSGDNLSLTAGVDKSGDQLTCRGYLGDMSSGPYFSFGTQSEEPGLLEMRNGLPRYRATDVTERNLQRIFTELETGSPPADEYVAEREMGQLVTPVELKNLQDSAGHVEDYRPDWRKEEYAALEVKGSHRVVFLPGNFFQAHLNKSKYRERFDMVVVSHNFVQFLSPALLQAVKPDCPLVVETRKFALAFDKKVQDFREEVMAKVKDLGGEEVGSADFVKDSMAVFKIKLEAHEKTTNELTV